MVDKAKLDLAYTTIISPVEGLIGTTQKKVGSLVGRGENTLLNTISQINPILFRCSIAEAEYLRLAKRTPEQQAQDKNFGVELILADGSVFPHKGRLDSIERAIDPTTGTLSGQFIFPNPERILRPSQYGKARIVIDVKHNAVLVPQRAVQEVQGLYTVMVVKPDGTVEQRMAKARDRVGSDWVLESGVKPGERVIVEGIQKVRPGIKVNAKLEKKEPSAASSPVVVPSDKSLAQSKGK